MMKHPLGLWLILLLLGSGMWPVNDAAPGPAASAPMLPTPPSTFQQYLLRLVEADVTFGVTFIVPLDVGVPTWWVGPGHADAKRLDLVGSDVLCFQDALSDVPTVRCTTLANVQFVEPWPSALTAAAVPSTPQRDQALAQVQRYASAAELFESLAAFGIITQPNGLFHARADNPSTRPHSPLVIMRFGPAAMRREVSEFTQFFPPREGVRSLCFDNNRDDWVRAICIAPHQIIELRWEVPLLDGVLPTPPPPPPTE